MSGALLCQGSESPEISLPKNYAILSKNTEDLGHIEQFSGIRTSGALNQSVGKCEVISWRTVTIEPGLVVWLMQGASVLPLNRWGAEHNKGVHRSFRSIVLLHMDLLQNSFFHPDTGHGSHQFEHSKPRAPFLDASLLPGSLLPLPQSSVASCLLDWACRSGTCFSVVFPSTHPSPGHWEMLSRVPMQKLWP